MRKITVFLFFCGCLLGCTSTPEEPVEYVGKHGSMLWSETLENGNYYVEINSKKVTLTSTSPDGRRTRSSSWKRPADEPVVFVSGTTVATDEHQMQVVNAAVILDQDLATRTKQIQLVLRNNDVVIETSKYGHGALFFVEPIPLPEDAVDENGNVTVTVGEGGRGDIPVCYRLLDKNNDIIYEQLQAYPYMYVSPDNVPNCQGISDNT